ncbi:TetR/AcrR family transcriptional regulator [Thaumasiovibrio subtropicus]|uniref:TetR/AcrR family transcriptional regulator n=2 Tax=Thaumasiovibrio subtropicus TaxID=1891207 RepID=UPI001C858DE5|nr:TetR/AcrR family transcriptional regulator [Thaumasiovibrio subtropicus]
MQIESKKDRIAEAALIAFGRYGYKKTSMQDIAEQAGMSRPALYQYYANKEKMFVGLVEKMFQRASEAAAPKWDVASDNMLEVLTEAVLAYEITLFEPVLKTARGIELIELAQQLTPERMQEGREYLQAKIVATLTRAEQQGQIDVSSLTTSLDEIAVLLLHGITGIKFSITSTDELARQTRLLFQLVWHGIDVAEQPSKVVS